MSKKNSKKSEGNNELGSQVTSSTTNGHMEIVIEKGISIPASIRAAKYPFDKLNPGESFVINKKTNGASVAVAYWKKKLPGRDFTVRALSEEDLKKLKDMGNISQEVTEASRVWRTDGIEA